MQTDVQLQTAGVIVYPVEIAGEWYLERFDTREYISDYSVGPPSRHCWTKDRAKAIRWYGHMGASYYGTMCGLDCRDERPTEAQVPEEVSDE